MEILKYRMYGEKNATLRTGVLIFKSLPEDEDERINEICNAAAKKVGDDYFDTCVAGVEFT